MSVSAYSPTVLEHFRRPRRSGALEEASVSAYGTNPTCGDRVRVQLAIVDGRVSAARFTAEACAVSVAAASLLLERVEGALLDDVARIDADDVLALLDVALPEGRRRCATLALEAVRDAVAMAREAGM